MSIGPAEIIIVLILALLVFGPKRLPQMGKSLGRGVREFKKAADTAKTELGLGEVTDSINDVKSTITEPLKDVTGTFGDLKQSVDLKSAIEAPVEGAAVAGAAAAAGTSAAATPTAPQGSAPVVVTSPGQAYGVVDVGPETPDVTPASVLADLTPPEAPEAPDTPAAEEEVETAVTAAADAEAPDAPTES